jgi:hypothetical protein
MINKLKDMKNNIFLFLAGMLLVISGCDYSEYDLPEPDGRLVGLKVDFVHISPRTGETKSNTFTDLYRTDETVEITVSSNKKVSRIDIVNSVNGSLLNTINVNGTEASVSVAVADMGIPFGQSARLYVHLYFDDAGVEGKSYPSMKSYRFTVLPDIPSIVNFVKSDGSRTEIATSEVNIQRFYNDPLKGIVAEFKPGVNSYLEVDDSPLLKFGATQDFSISLWIKSAHNISDPAVLGTMNWNSSNNPGLLLAWRNGRIRVVAGDGAGTKVDYNQNEDVHPRMLDNAWHLITVTFEREGWSRLYIDGQLNTSAAMSPANIDVPGVTLKINQDGTGSYGDKLGAEYARVNFYDHILTPAQIAALYAAGN